MITLAIWTVYDHPKDYPDKFVARRFDVSPGKVEASGSIIIMDKLKDLRDMLEFEMHLSCIARHPEDEPQIVEAWI